MQEEKKINSQEEKKSWEQPKLTEGNIDELTLNNSFDSLNKFDGLWYTS
ncbi:hypothetical protein PBAL39_05198 [Pedobacter sp. BAL39]|nr:hypothetical protein PBAL39_05198 [Pedobacter sp. BAL39]